MSGSLVALKELLLPMFSLWDMSESGSAAQRSSRADSASHSCSPSPQVDPERHGSFGKLFQVPCITL